PVISIARDHVALAGVIEAPAVGADPVVRGTVLDDDSSADRVVGWSGDRLRAVAQRDAAGDVRPDEVARHRVAVGIWPRDPDAREHVPADQVPLARIGDAVAVGPDQILGGPRVDLDPDVIGRGLRPGRVGAEEVARDPVARRAGACDPDAGAL